MEDSQRSRVYASKQELDKWRYRRLNGISSKTRNLKRLKKWLFASLGTVLFISIALILLFSVKPTKNFEILDLRKLDIVTAEFYGAGRLQIWRPTSNAMYQNVWTHDSARHTSVAVGDVNEDGNLEIVAPGVLQIKDEEDENRTSYCQFFLDVYKEGYAGVWRSTREAEGDCLFEPENFGRSEIAIGELDGIEGQEIVVMTAGGLGIYKYAKDGSEFRLISSRYDFIDNVKVYLQSLCLADINEDGHDEIVLTVNEWADNGIAINKGTVQFFSFRNGLISLIKSIQIDASFSYTTLRVGDLTPEIGLEILTVGNRKVADMMYLPVILGWDRTGKKIIDHPIIPEPQRGTSSYQIDIGDVAPFPGKEIVVGTYGPDELIILNWDGDKLVERIRYSLPNKTFINCLKIIDRDEYGLGESRIVVCGSGRSEEEGSGRFYLEVFSFLDDLKSQWIRIGGGKKERAVRYISIVN
jgi:hypothetical protein